MQKLIAKYGLAAHLAFVVIAPLFLSTGAVLWLTLLAAIWLVMEPSQIGAELLHDARARVGFSLRADPLVWTLFAVALLAGVRCLNAGVALDYDAENAVWLVSSPACTFLPGATEGTGSREFGGLLALALVVSACRHALGRSARLAFVFLTSAAAGIFALFFAYFLANGDPSAVRASQCLVESPAYLGAIFGLSFIGSLCGMLALFERNWYRLLPVGLFSLVGSLLGLFIFTPSRSQVLYLALGFLLFIYSLFYARKRLPLGVEFRYLLMIGLALGAVAFISVAILPSSDLAARLAPYTTGEFFPTEFLSLRERLSAFAFRIWRERPWFGGALGSFSLHLGFLATAEDWLVVPSLQRAPLNGYWALLAERGTVGAFLAAAPLVMMLLTFARRLIDGVRQDLPHPAAWVGPCALVAALLDLIFSVSCLEPVALLLVAAYLAISANFFPKKR